MFASLWTWLKRLVVFGSVCVVSLSILVSLVRTSYTIDVNNLSGGLASKLDKDVIATMLREQVSAGLNAARADAVVKPISSDHVDPELKIGDTSLSLIAVIRDIRYLIGWPEPHLRADFFPLKDVSLRSAQPCPGSGFSDGDLIKYRLIVTKISDGTGTFLECDGSLQDAVEAGGDAILSAIDPIAFAAYTVVRGTALENPKAQQLYDAALRFSEAYAAMSKASELSPHIAQLVPFYSSNVPRAEMVAGYAARALGDVDGAARHFQRANKEYVARALTAKGWAKALNELGLLDFVRSVVAQDAARNEQDQSRAETRNAEAKALLSSAEAFFDRALVADPRYDSAQFNKIQVVDLKARGVFQTSGQDVCDAVVFYRSALTRYKAFMTEHPNFAIAAHNRATLINLGLTRYLRDQRADCLMDGTTVAEKNASAANQFEEGEEDFFLVSSLDAKLSVNWTQWGILAALRQDDVHTLLDRRGALDIKNKTAWCNKAKDRFARGGDAKAAADWVATCLP